MRINKFFQAIVALGFTTTIPLSAVRADIIEAVPTAWRLENYVGATGVAAWYTGSPCTTGALSFNSSATADDKNRFWSLVMTAKVSGKPIGVAYTNVSGSCQIVSFYLKEQ